MDRRASFPYANGTPMGGGSYGRYGQPPGFYPSQATTLNQHQPRPLNQIGPDSFQNDPYEEMLHSSRARPFGPSSDALIRRMPNYSYRETNYFPTSAPAPLYNAHGLPHSVPGQHFNTLPVSDGNKFYNYGLPPTMADFAGDRLFAAGTSAAHHSLSYSGFADSESELADPIAALLAKREAMKYPVSYFNAVPARRSGIGGMTNSEGEQPAADWRNGNRLKKLMGVAEEKDLWLETRTGQPSSSPTDLDDPLGEDRMYYYNPGTLKVRFDKPNPAYATVLNQTEVQKLLDNMTPSTLIVKRTHNQLTEQTIRSYFGQFGRITFVKICRYREVISPSAPKKANHRNLVYFRMETVQAQKRILEQTFFEIDGHEVEVRAPSNRIFVARLPDHTSLDRLASFFSQLIWKIDPHGYCIDAYHPLPYKQFAFLTCGGLQIGAKLALKADFVFQGCSLTVASCHTEEESNAGQLFDDKIRALVDRNELAKVRALQCIQSELKFLLQVLSKMRKFGDPMLLLGEINKEFLKCSEEKLRNYLYVQEQVFDVCKLIALREDPQEEAYVSRRKRMRMEGGSLHRQFAENACEHGEVVDSEEEQEQEEIDNFGEDEIAREVTKGIGPKEEDGAMEGSAQTQPIQTQRRVGDTQFVTLF